MAKVGAKGETRKIEKRAPGTREVVVEPIDTALGPVFSEGWDERADAPDLHDSGAYLFRCSMLGDCPSALVAYALEETPVEPPENIRARMDEGKRLERELIDRALGEMNAKVVTFPDMVKLVENGVIAGYNHDVHGDGAGGQVQVRLKVKGGGSKGLLFGHLDELIQFKDTGEIAFIEAKLLGEDLWKSWSTNKKVNDFLLKALDGKYAWQVSGQIAACGLPAIVVAGQKIGKDGEGDGASIGDVQWKRVDDAPYSKKEVKARLKEALAGAVSGVVPACSEGRFGCPYFGFTFHEKKKDETKWLLDKKYDQLLEYVRERAIARMDRSDADERFKRAGEHIDALMDELELERGKKYGVEDDAHNRFTVRWVTKEMPERDVHYDASVQSYPDVRLVEEK